MSTSTGLLPPLPEFYQGRAILITGGSGFMGKMLIEKLLRSCSSLETIYLLLRPKRGKPAASRLDDIIKDVLFDTLRATSPSVFKKLKVVAGDVTERGLGLSDKDRATLQEEVEVVFHSAASVRFDDPLSDAILINVRGPKEMIELALGMKRLTAFLHVSTTFCNIDKPKVLEQVLPIDGDWNWRTLLALAEDNKNDHMLHCLQSKILGRLPNTYTFTKALGEQVINDYKDRLPLVIVRPSIVLPPKFQSRIGWVDNVNGPVSFWVAAYVGLIRVLLMDPDIRLDYVPVDQAINAFLFIACHRALTPVSQDELLPVYNCSNLMSSGCELEVIAKGVAVYQDHPTLKAINYPSADAIKSQPCYTAHILLFHLVPYFFMDLATRLTGGKPMLVKFLRRIYYTSITMGLFTRIQTNFDNSKLMALERRMAKEDLKDFWFAKVVGMDMEYVAKTLLFLREHLLKDPLETLPEARQRLNRIFWLKTAASGLTYCVALWLICNSGVLEWLGTTGSALRYKLMLDGTETN